MCKSVTMRFCTGPLVILLASVFSLILSAGCTVPSTSSITPHTIPPASEVRQTGDSAYLSLYEASQSAIANGLERMNRNFPVGAATRNAPYLAGELRSSALELKVLADGYHTSMIRIESFQEKENEFSRNEYLKYLSGIRKIAGNCADAAGAEMDLQFALAQNYAETARNAVKDVEGMGGIIHKDLLKTTGVSLDDYVRKMREKRV